MDVSCSRAAGVGPGSGDPVGGMKIKAKASSRRCSLDLVDIATAAFISSLIGAVYFHVERSFMISTVRWEFIEHVCVCGRP